jgi:streptomycin 6-kinase
MRDLPTTIGPGITIPTGMMQRLINWNGRDALALWFETLPERLDSWCADWEIDLESRDLPDTVSLVLFGTSKQVGPVVIKIGPPNFERNAEIAATRAAAGPGMVRLIADDPDLSLIMLERLEPGSQLADERASDEAMTQIVAERLRAFWSVPPDPTGLIPLERWTQELRQFTPSDLPGVPNDLVLHAQSLLEEMLARPSSQSLLHGDLHHHNVLWQEGFGWTTIDPKGLIGERGFDVTAWMMNPWGFPLRDDFLPVANRRLDILATELGEERPRLAQWCVVFAALNVCWSLGVDHPEDFGGDVAILQNMTRLLTHA